MTTAITVLCDGRDGTCPSRELVLLAATPSGARVRMRRHGWVFIDGRDLCRDCQVDPHGQLSEAGVTPERHWSER